MSQKRFWQLTLPAALLAAQFAFAQPATPVSIDIEAQPLAAALTRFAEQTGVKTLYAAELLAGKTAPAVRGQLSPAVALAQLLAGSGLRFESAADGAVTIEATAAEGGAPVRLRAVTVSAAGASASAERYAVPVASAATKTDTPLMETPISIQVVPQQVLQDQKVLTLDQALVNVSGVRSSSNRYPTTGSQTLYLRGFQSNTVLRNGAWLNDPDYVSPMGTQTLSNVDSVEVMKGPAAILYGRVEPGGIVNIVTKKPLKEAQYSLEQLVGSWDQYVTRFDATGPLNDDKSVLYRVNASYDTSRSWQDAVHGENMFVAPTLTWAISPKTQVTLEAEYSHNPAAVNVLYVPFDPTTQKLVRVPRSANVDHWSTNTDMYLVELNWSHEFNDGWKISQRLAHHRVNAPHDNGYYAGFFGTNHVGNSWTADMIRLGVETESTTDSTEVNLLGHFQTLGLQHTLLLGTDYHQFKSAQTQRASSLAGPYFTQDLLKPANPGGLSLEPTTYVSGGQVNASYGAYAQDQIKLPHGVDLLTGLRWQKLQLNRKSWQQIGAGLGGDDSIQRFADSAYYAFTPRVGALWRAQDWLSLYGNYAENFSPNSGKDWHGSQLKPQSAQQFELGGKVELDGGKLTSSLAVFELTKTDIGAPDVLHDPSGLFGYQVSVGEVRSRGVEFDIQGEVRRGLNLIASYTYTDITVTRTTAGSGYVQGNRMPNVPRNMVNLAGTYEFQGDTWHGWKVGGGVTAYDSATDQSNTFRTPGYAVANAMVSYAMKSGQGRITTLQLNVNNLFNRTYATDLQPYDGNSLVYGTPRSFVASVKVDF